MKEHLTKVAISSLLLLLLFFGDEPLKLLGRQRMKNIYQFIFEKHLRSFMVPVNC